MRRISAICLACCAALAACAPPAPQEPPSEWPQFRGARRDGSADSRLLRAWPASDPLVSWKQALGPGFSQLAVAGGRLFAGFSDAEQEYLGAFDPQTGTELWRASIGPVFVQEEFGSGPRSTPSIVDEVVFALGGSGRLVALQTADGATKWQVELTEAFGAEAPRFGYSGSPLVVDDLVIVDAGGSEKRGLVALIRESGELRWSGFEGPAGYASPVVAELEGTKQIVHSRGGEVSGISLEGQPLWSYKLDEGVIADPLILPDNRVFVSASGDTGCVMLRIRRGADGLIAEELWKNRNMRNHFNSSVYADGSIYGFDNATLKCLSADTGDVLWGKRGLGKGSVSLAGDRLLILGDLGLLTVAERTPEAFRELGRLQLVEGSRAWTAPSIAGGRVFARNLAEMACIDLGETKS